MKNLSDFFKEIGDGDAGKGMFISGLTSLWVAIAISIIISAFKS